MKKAAITVGFIALCSGIMLSTAFAADPIKIGVLLPLSGRNAAIGQIQQKAVLMAAKDIKARGRIKDRKIELFVEDTQGHPDGGRAAIKTLIQRHRVLAISGGFSSSATWATSAIAQQSQIPFVVTSATADKITEQGWEYVFRLNQPLSEHLDTLASFLSTKASDIKSVAIVHAPSLRSSAAARRFFKRSAELGLDLVARERFGTGTNDLSQMLTRIKAKNPDCIYAVADGFGDAALLARQSKSLMLNPKLFVGQGIGFAHTGFTTQAGAASNHIVSIALWTPLVPYRDAGAFHKKFIEQHDTPPGRHGAEAYTGITVIADALQRVQELTPALVRDALAHTNMTTLLGPVQFVAYNQKSQQNKLPTFLVQWINGKQEIIWPKEFATHRPIYPPPHSSEDRVQKSDDR